MNSAGKRKGLNSKSPGPDLSTKTESNVVGVNQHDKKKGNSRDDGLSNRQLAALIVCVCTFGFLWLSRERVPPQSIVYDVSKSPGSSSSLGSLREVMEEVSRMEGANKDLGKDLDKVRGVNEGLRGRVEEKREERGGRGGRGGGGEGGGGGSSIETAPLPPQPAPEVPMPVTKPEEPSPPSPGNAHKPDLHSIEVNSIPSYTGYTFWSNDFHVSPISDVMELFQPDKLNQKVIVKSLSNHCKFVSPPICADDLRILDKGNAMFLGTNTNPGLGWIGCPNMVKRKVRRVEAARCICCPVLSVN